MEKDKNDEVQAGRSCVIGKKKKKKKDKNKKKRKINKKKKRNVVVGGLGEQLVALRMARERN